MKIIKQIVKKILNKVGLNVSSYKKYPEFLLHHKIELLFDVVCTKVLASAVVLVG